jgi:hypothetical protein
MGIKPGRDQNPLRFIPVSDGNHYLIKHPEVLFVAAASGKWNVDRITLTFSRAHLPNGPSAWVVGILMGRNVKNRRVLIECLLGTVSMMDIPVHDQNPLRPVIALEVMGADSCSVKKAKAHRTVPEGMMTGWAHQGKTVLEIPGGYRIQQF